MAILSTTLSEQQQLPNHHLPPPPLLRLIQHRVKHHYIITQGERKHHRIHLTNKSLTIMLNVRIKLQLNIINNKSNKYERGNS